MTTTPLHSPARGDVYLAINTLLDEHAATKRDRPLTMRKIAHFATFFGNVLPTNQVPAMLIRPINPFDSKIHPVQPQLALPAVKTAAGAIALVESVVPVPFPRSPHLGSGYDNQTGRLTEIRAYPAGEPNDYWGGEGIVLGALKPHPAAGGNTHHHLETPAGRVDHLGKLQHLITLTNAVLTHHGIAPYPGYSAR